MTVFKTPEFWYPKTGDITHWWQGLLSPLSWLYGLLFYLHQNLSKPYKAEIPIVCLGNIVAGGTGKTPTALALLTWIKQEKLALAPYFLIRGYGGAETGPLLVNPDMHCAWDVGDEALILSQKAPTIVATDRAAGAKFAQANGADLIIMDDGLQNPGIFKDTKLLIINGEMGFGNRKLLPAGPLRQPLSQGLQNADAYIFLGEDHQNIQALLPPEKPIIQAKIIVRDLYAMDHTQNYLAFAGLGYPKKFFNFLKQDCQLNIVHAIAFSDHFPYQEQDILDLKTKAQQYNAKLITTEKDFLRIPQHLSADIEMIPITVDFQNPLALIAILDKSKIK